MGIERFKLFPARIEVPGRGWRRDRSQCSRRRHDSYTQLSREAASLVSIAIKGIVDPFAVHGFASDGRHEVQ